MEEWIIIFGIGHYREHLYFINTSYYSFDFSEVVEITVICIDLFVFNSFYNELYKLSFALFYLAGITNYAIVYLCAKVNDIQRSYRHPLLLIIFVCPSVSRSDRLFVFLSLSVILYSVLPIHASLKVKPYIDILRYYASKWPGQIQSNKTWLTLKCSEKIYWWTE